ncbi:hypothetical protein PHYPSEUDO_005173 [Phytophthora pseudosyringae]|uniref:PX domain-containing protein n=1 Tax=Phytophthora pseudosyringae TaxID=221518 RepID=A0A8T1VLK7_9STRA|nr:hypothetical protein PHYPSEUDO_005173 [Phytophthora pseudosyringae]
MVGSMIENSSCSTVSTASTSSSSSGACSAPRSAASLKRAGPVAVPEAVAWLDHLTLELQTAPGGGKAQYQLTMRYAPAQQKLAAAATWTISRSFDEYRAFQKRLLKRMQQGHSCGAECKWLYKVVKHYFPQKSLFCNNCPKVVAARQQTLIRCLTTVQASLVNRGNHGCRVLVHDVAAEFNRFVVKGMKDLEANATASDSPSSELSAVTRDSLDSLDSESEAGESESESEDEDEEERECDACHSRHVVCRTHSSLAA